MLKEFIEIAINFDDPFGVACVLVGFIFFLTVITFFVNFSMDFLISRLYGEKSIIEIIWIRWRNHRKMR